MSSVTTQLRYVVKQCCDDIGITDYENEDNWSHIANRIGLSDYPIFDESHRATLNAKIIRHYWLREIGSETLAQFKWRLRDSMYLVMPRYNWLFEQVDALENSKAGFTTHGDSWTETYYDNHTGDREHTAQNENQSSVTGNSTDTSSSEMNNQFEDTPMDFLEMSANYATNRTKETNEVTDTNTSFSHSNGTENNKFNDTDNYHNDGVRVHETDGYDKSAFAQMSDRYEAYRNIDLEIVNDPYIRRCFLGVWM